MKYCKVCGQAITERTSNNTLYCSAKCARKAESKQNTPRIAHRAKRVNKVSQHIYDAYNHRCAICGWRATEELIKVRGGVQRSYGNEIHHIQPVSKGGGESADNLILLCPNHHKQADLGIIKQDYLKSLTRPMHLTEEKIITAKSECADAISAMIFD